MRAEPGMASLNLVPAWSGTEERRQQRLGCQHYSIPDGRSPRI